MPSPPLCGPEWAQELAQDILSSLKEQLQQRRGPTMPEGGQEWGPVRPSYPNTKMRPHKEDCEMMTPTTVTLLRPGRPIGGH